MKSHLPVVLALLCLSQVASLAQEQPLTPDQQAVRLLDSAHRAFAERKYEASGELFTRFLASFANHPQANAARYGLAVCVLSNPTVAEPDFAKAAELLTVSVAQGDLPDRGFALYYLGMAQRGLGLKLIEQRPAGTQAVPPAAVQRLTEAARSFANAQVALAAAAKGATGNAATELAEWSVRARGQQAEMLLRIDKSAEAATAATATLSDPSAGPGDRELALYHLGHARFDQGDHLAAGRALSRLAPFSDKQPWTLHAQYMLGRIHHLAAERPEAAAAYTAVLAGYAQQRQQAASSMAL